MFAGGITDRSITNAKTHRVIVDKVARTKGVEPDSVRVSLELAALSFAYDPQRASFASIQRALERPMSRMDQQATKMKILDLTSPTTAKH